MSLNFAILFALAGAPERKIGVYCKDDIYQTCQTVDQKPILEEGTCKGYEQKNHRDLIMQCCPWEHSRTKYRTFKIWHPYNPCEAPGMSGIEADGKPVPVGELK